MSLKDRTIGGLFYLDEDNMSSWLSGHAGQGGGPEHPQEESFQCGESSHEDNTHEDGIREPPYSSDTIRKLIGYKWLITAIKRSIHVDTSSDQAQDHRSIMLRSLESIDATPELIRISRMRSPALYTTVYEIPWDLTRFLREQGYDAELSPNTIGRVITLTGGAEFAQAISCEGYMEQMWPLTGADIIELLEDMIRVPDEDHTGKQVSLSFASDYNHLEIPG